ncbi:DUF3800 domain-containing protein [Bosea sp. (in: a-proteobacteria)]|uniref:DUF3800 domain-containing protein n=1 Tax=Bosea sp. (in: a-proteobacteria) TaxID=1871050 RepID=UPI002B47159B|nr:DUF3800 domain-containing protein [Bosea sp. (in: a-proteobacteria)]WRH58482.1 MAG: DUF3800 domain-containing protein [Bosea sp. (in: a-proteobacteria)]
MSWSLFIDESGQDQRHSPYEVLAGIAIEDRRIWPLIRQLSDAQMHIFGMRLYQAYGKEAKAMKLLNKKVFRLAAQMPPIEKGLRTRLTREILQDGTQASRERLTALAQSKIEYCRFALGLARGHGAQAFATMVGQDAPRPPSADHLRKDYSYLFERFFYFLNGLEGDPMGYLVFDELDKTQSHILLGQVSSYFIKTQNGRTRSRLIIPEPFFVHSDLTTLIQLTDIMAYVISWGLRLKEMHAPAREELAPLVEDVLRIRFHRRTEAGQNEWGFRHIKDLRPADLGR